MGSCHQVQVRLGKRHSHTSVDGSYTIAQWLCICPESRRSPCPVRYLVRKPVVRYLIQFSLSYVKVYTSKVCSCVTIIVIMSLRMSMHYDSLLLTHFMYLTASHHIIVARNIIFRTTKNTSFTKPVERLDLSPIRHAKHSCGE